MAMSNVGTSLASTHLETIRQTNREVVKRHGDICGRLAEIRKTGVGADFSSVMGDISSQAGRITRAEVFNVAVSDMPLYTALRDLFVNPRYPYNSNHHREQVCAVIAEFASSVAARAAWEDVSSLMLTFQSELSRHKYDIEDLVDKTTAEVGKYHAAVKDAHESAVSFYDEQYPMASERLRVIDRFVDDKEWITKMLGRKLRQEAVVAEAQDAVARFQDTYPDGPFRTRAVRDKQMERKEAESELQSIEDAMIRRLRGNWASIRQRQ